MPHDFLFWTSQAVHCCAIANYYSEWIPKFSVKNVIYLMHKENMDITKEMVRLLKTSNRREGLSNVGILSINLKSLTQYFVFPQESGQR